MNKVIRQIQEVTLKVLHKNNIDIKSVIFNYLINIITKD